MLILARWGVESLLEYLIVIDKSINHSVGCNWVFIAKGIHVCDAPQNPQRSGGKVSK